MLRFDHDEPGSQPRRGRRVLRLLCKPPPVIAQAFWQSWGSVAGLDAVRAHGGNMPRRIADFVQRVRSNSGIFGDVKIRKSSRPIVKTACQSRFSRQALPIRVEWRRAFFSSRSGRASPSHAMSGSLVRRRVGMCQKIKGNRQGSSESWCALGIVKQFAGCREWPEKFEQQRLFLGVYPMARAVLGYRPDFRQIIGLNLLGFDVFGQGRVLRLRDYASPAFIRTS